MKNSDEKKQIFAVCSILTAIFCFYLCAGLLYPMRGDDFQLQYTLRSMSIWDIICDTYMNWTMRLGNIVNVLVASVRSKILFDILNSSVQTSLILLIASAAAGKPVSLSRSSDRILLVFAAGLSFFVCRPADTVYWIPGATLYSWSAVVYLSAFLYLLHCLKHKFNIRLAAVLTVCSFLSGYTNENVALTGILFLTLLAVVKPSPFVFCALAGWTGGGLFLFTTPGIAKRIAYASSAGAGKGISLSIADTLGKIPEIAGFYAVSSAVPLLALVLLIVIFRRSITAGTLKKSAAAVGLSVFAALVFAGAPLPPMRSYYVCSLLVMVACVIVFNEAGAVVRHKEYAAVAMLSAGLILIFSVLPDFVKIHRDEVNRHNLIEAAKQRGQSEIIVPEHHVLRRSLLQYIFIEDITADPGFWLNRNAAIYYGVQKISTETSAVETPAFRNNFMKFIRMEK